MLKIEKNNFIIVGFFFRKRKRITKVGRQEGRTDSHSKYAHIF